MTETDGAAANPPANTAPSPPGIRILAQFVRDLSFENPRAPESLRGTGEAPQIDLGVEMNARMRPDNLYEVDLKLSAAARSAAEPVFQVELLYGGLFHVEGVPEEDTERVLLVECTRFLFPFARRIMADVTSEGGFPPFMLDPIDFAAVYEARRAQLEGPAAGQA